MDSIEITNRYMAEYNKLVAKHENETIQQLVEDINKAILERNVENINILYNKLSEWNAHVANIQGARIALNAQFKHIKLPSVAEFMVVFDNINKGWRFNTEAE